MTTTQRTKTITTTYNPMTGRITAKGMGRQRTSDYDSRSSAARNHGNAAAVLALVLGLPWSESITHMGFNDGTHKFNFPA